LRARALVIGLAAAAAALAATGCGGKDDNAAPAPGAAQLTIYSSLPLQGPTRLQSLALVNAEKLALSQSGGRVGAFTVKYVSLDDSRASSERWDPGAVLSNARRAIEDRTAIAYIGEADSGASAIAIPALNTAGLLTVSPVSTYPGLTSTRSADKGEPEKYYPSRQRTFARVVPADDRQASVQVRLQHEAGCRKLFVVSDRDVYGRGIASAVAHDATAHEIDIAGEIPLLNGQKDFGDVGRRVSESGADCVFTGVSLTTHTTALYDALYDAAPQAKLFGPDALDDPVFTDALAPDVAEQVTLTSLALLPTARSKRFERAYRKRYGEAPEPYAIYGYEAIKAVLRSLRNAGNGANRRAEVVRQFFALRDRNSVVGRYSITPDGDTTLDAYTIVRFPNGRRSVHEAMTAGGT
jgi:branched-chain amino acid transport system substrate-binding protein